MSGSASDLALRNTKLSERAFEPLNSCAQLWSSSGVGPLAVYLMIFLTCSSRLKDPDGSPQFSNVLRAHVAVPTSCSRDAWLISALKSMLMSLLDPGWHPCQSSQDADLGIGLRSL